MKVISYLKGIPKHNKNIQKTQILHEFISGVNKGIDTGLAHDEETIVPADVAIMQGWVYNDLTTPHLRFRKKIIDFQKNNGKRLIIADASCFRFADEINRFNYLKYSFDGIFPTTGNYCDSHINKDRWASIRYNLNLDILPYKNNGKYILLLAQRSGGWSMKNLNILDWLVDTITKIKVHSDRKIIIRPHPGDRKAKVYITHLNNLQLPNVKVSVNKSLDEDLAKTWVIVNHNSSAAVGPIIQGYHCFLTDYIDSHNQEVSHSDFKYLEQPLYFDRQSWLERISMFHWNFEELRNGVCWQHMKKFV